MTLPPFELAVRTHGALVLRVCRAALGPGPDADDAWSETFVSALRAWPDLPDHTNVEAWLVRVAQRRTIDILRSRGRTPVPHAQLPDAATSDATSDPDLWRAVAELPERQRLAVAYHYLGGLPHAETAELTGSTPAAVRRAAADGVASLRRRLTPQEPV